MLVNTSVQITVNNSAGSFFSGNVNDWAVTILHELGHAYWDLYGPSTSAIQPDGPSIPDGVQISENNTKLIKKDCNL